MSPIYIMQTLASAYGAASHRAVPLHPRDNAHPMGEKDF